MDTYGRQTRREQCLDPTPNGSSVSMKRTILEFAFLAFALAPLFHFGNRAFLETFSTVFAAIVLEALPFMLIGSVVSGLLGEFASQARILKLLSKGGGRRTFYRGGPGPSVSRVRVCNRSYRQKADAKGGASWAFPGLSISYSLLRRGCAACRLPGLPRGGRLL